jgi:hypothetical protein
MTILTRPRTEQRALNLLRFGPCQKRARGWRFGTAIVPEQIVARLVAQGQVQIEGDVLRLLQGAPIGAGTR